MDIGHRDTTYACAPGVFASVLRWVFESRGQLSEFSVGIPREANFMIARSYSVGCDTHLYQRVLNNPSI